MPRYSAWGAVHRVIVNGEGHSMHGGPSLEVPFVAQISLIDWMGSITLGLVGDLLPFTVPECILSLRHGDIEENASAYKVWVGRIKDLEYLGLKLQGRELSRGT